MANSEAGADVKVEDVRAEVGLGRRRKGIASKDGKGGKEGEERGGLSLGWMKGTLVGGGARIGWSLLCLSGRDQHSLQLFIYMRVS